MQKRYFVISKSGRLIEVDVKRACALLDVETTFRQCSEKRAATEIALLIKDLEDEYSSVGDLDEQRVISEEIDAYNWAIEKYDLGYSYYQEPTIAIAKNAVGGVASLVGDILGFARKQVAESGVINDFREYRENRKQVRVKRTKLATPRPINRKVHEDRNESSQINELLSQNRKLIQLLEKMVDTPAKEPNRQWTVAKSVEEARKETRRPTERVAKMIDRAKGIQRPEVVGEGDEVFDAPRR